MKLTGDDRLMRRCLAAHIARRSSCAPYPSRRQALETPLRDVGLVVQDGGRHLSMRSKCRPRSSFRLSPGSGPCEGRRFISRCGTDARLWHAHSICSGFLHAVPRPLGSCICVPARLIRSLQGVFFDRLGPALVAAIFPPLVLFAMQQVR